MVSWFAPKTWNFKGPKSRENVGISVHLLTALIQCGSRLTNRPTESSGDLPGGPGEQGISLVSGQGDGLYTGRARHVTDFPVERCETNGITCLANAVWARSDGCFGAISTAVGQIGSPLKSLVLAESMRALLNRLQFMSTQLRQLMKVEII